MSIDPNKKYVYHCPPDFHHGKPVTQLRRFDVDAALGVGPWVGVCDGLLLFFSDCDVRLREVDPVLYYTNHYRPGVGCAVDCFKDCLTSHGAPRAIARTATHESGKVRQIPLDATEDPEAHA